MPKPEKVATVQALKELFTNAQGIYLTDFRGLDVAAMTELRRRLKASGGGYKVGTSSEKRTSSKGGRGDTGSSDGPGLGAFGSSP